MLIKFCYWILSWASYIHFTFLKNFFSYYPPIYANFSTVIPSFEVSKLQFCKHSLLSPTSKLVKIPHFKLKGHQLYLYSNATIRKCCSRGVKQSSVVAFSGSSTVKWWLWKEERKISACVEQENIENRQTEVTLTEIWIMKWFFMFL
jgi:hypothetical protein